MEVKTLGTVLETFPKQTVKVSSIQIYFVRTTLMPIKAFTQTLPSPPPTMLLKTNSYQTLVKFTQSTKMNIVWERGGEGFDFILIALSVPRLLTSIVVYSSNWDQQDPTDIASACQACGESPGLHRLNMTKIIDSSVHSIKLLLNPLIIHHYKQIV